MEKKRLSYIDNYRLRINQANKELTKKELFKDLLNRLYSGEKEIERIIDKISAGAETTILNIPRKDKIHRGSADTLYSKVIIEFENDLKVTLKLAKEQLAGYLLGQYRTGEGYNFVLIASDFITWKVFAPDIDCLDRLDTLHEDELGLNEIVGASFTLNETNAEDFFYWIDRYLFKEEKQKATLKRIEEAFGYQSNVFIESYKQMSVHFEEVKKYGEVQVSFEQWRKFLSIAYGSFDASERNFLIHTYLSIFAKILAYSVVSNDDFIDDEEMKGILDGGIFYKYNIKNFVDNDFFHWVKSDRNFTSLKKVFRLIAQEISTFDFQEVEEDVLKGVYQELIDLDTRHSLGEYYTPDWLCERVVNEFEFKIGGKILDPSCGSGSFLRAALHRLKKLYPSITIEEICNSIYGIDIHPLSVQIAKTTMLLALGKDIANSKKQVQINIILANTLLAPEGIKNLFGGEFQMMIDKDKYYLNTKVFEDVSLFDEALELCDKLAGQTQNKKSVTIDGFGDVFKQKFNGRGVDKDIATSFYQVYKGLKLVKEKGRDSIWKFILQNLYKPYFLADKFDYIIGNPPWFTYSSIKNEEYQDLLNALAEKYKVKPDKVANFPHLEIAAIFLAYCSSYFLKDNGKIAFVLPRSFFSSDHHDNSRSGKAKGFKLSAIWDLQNVSPLFRVPTCVLFAEKAQVRKRLPLDGLAGLSLKGNLPTHNCNLLIANTKLVEERVSWYYSKQGKSTAFTNSKVKKQTQVNPYKKEFKQGATIVPRTFYFVEVDMAFDKDWERDFDWSDRIINLRTSKEIIPDAKMPWKEIKFSGLMPSKYIFRTALSKSILPFALHKPDLVVLPIKIDMEGGNKKITLLEPDKILDLDASKWFRNGENIWGIHSTEKNKTITMSNYLNWQNKLVDQNLNAPFIVLYNASAKDANATVVKREEMDLEFIVESKGYAYYTSDLLEAHYLTAILNALTPNQMMKAFQTKGLFGARDVHKKILDIYYQRFDKKNITHQKLAELGRNSHEKVTAYLNENQTEKTTSTLQLGKLRSNIKKHLKEELMEIDLLVKKVII